MKNNYLIKITLIILFGIFHFSTGYAQSTDTSSLIQKINSSSDESEKLKHMLLLCEVLMEQKEDNRLSEYAMDAFRLSSNLGDEIAKVEACYYLTNAYTNLREYDQCAYYGKIGLGLAKKNGVKKREAHFCNTLGSAERRMDNCDTAIN